MIEPGVVLIAIGGNALVHEGESGSLCRQQERSAAFARQVVELVEAGWRVLVTHGNGPQVGFILRRGELVAPDATVEGLPELPLWLAVADSQGGIGHLLCLAIDDALIAHDRPERAVAVLTHVEVDADDPAFGHPTKPIGGLLTADSARRRVTEEGWSVVETAPGVFRRVVPSPAPTAILEAAQVRSLLNDAGAVVIAAGGGGIPLVSRDGQWAAVDAVVDKDRSSALLAAQTGVDTMVLVTGVDEVYVDFGRPTQRALHDVTADEMRAHHAAGQFPAGSMGPKVESALRFVDAGGRRSIITSLERLPDALADKGGTHINGRPEPERAE
jgi:carbamate kinase